MEKYKEFMSATKFAKENKIIFKGKQGENQELQALKKQQNT